MIRAVLFDLDGVLVDSFEAWWSLIAGLALERGAPRVSRLRFVATFGQGVDEDVRLFFPGADETEIAAAYEAGFADHLDGLTVMSGAAEVLGALRRDGVRTGVVTNTPTRLARAILGRAALDPGPVVGSDDVAAPKPDPAMIRLGCERCGVAPEDAVVVGDSVYDRQAATAAGVRFVGFRRPGRERIERLEELVEFVRRESGLAS